MIAIDKLDGVVHALCSDMGDVSSPDELMVMSEAKGLACRSAK